MTTRPMTEDELFHYFGDTNQRGIIVEHDGEICGWTGWNRTGETGFYAHSTFCDDRYPHAYAALIQALRCLCKKVGSPAIEFYIDTENEWFMKRMQKLRGVKEMRRVFELMV